VSQTAEALFTDLMPHIFKSIFYVLVLLSLGIWPIPFYSNYDIILAHFYNIFEDYIPYARLPFFQFKVIWGDELISPNI